MFGDAYDFVSEKAKNAYKTVQMSQNDYLQQVNGFATGLKSALDGNAVAAAELADRIITAEADVVAATGNTQEAVQNAFKSKEARSAAESTLQAFIDGMNSKVPGIMSTMQSIGQQIRSSLQSGIGTVTIPVNIQTSGNIPGFATGLDFVPYDNYLAYLHKGEAVLTAAEAKAWRNGDDNARGQATGVGTTIIQNIDTVPQTPAEFAAATAAYFEQARWTM